jgi:chaperonin GroES
MEFQPFYDRVLVRPEVEETTQKSDSGLFVVSSIKQDVRLGTVIAVGEGRISPEGTLIENSAKVGDRVMFHIKDAIVYQEDERDKKVAILRDVDVIAVVTD